MSDDYYVYPVLAGTDYREHTDEQPFCDDLSCPCHEDSDNNAMLQEWQRGW